MEKCKNGCYAVYMVMPSLWSRYVCKRFASSGNCRKWILAQPLIGLGNRLSESLKIDRRQQGQGRRYSPAVATIQATDRTLPEPKAQREWNRADVEEKN
jgi:hypothetical protein